MTARLKDWISAWKILKAGEFDPAYYARENPALRGGGRWGRALHYLLWGGREGRNPSAALFLPYFCHLHPEAEPRGGFVLRHYLAIRDSRRGWPDEPAIRPLIYDYPGQLQCLRESGLFDAEYYLQHHPDLRIMPEDALTHYCWTGWREGRHPHPMLPHHFLEAFLPDVWRGQINPLVYFLKILPERRRLEAWSRAGGRFYGECTLHGLLINRVDWDFTCQHPPRLSVVMVVRNHAAWTALSLQSLKAERDPYTELVLVDNGSTDETAELCARLRGVTLLRAEHNLGFGEACNWGIQQARGRHILFLNNDVMLQPGALSVSEAALESAPDIGAVGGRLIHFDGSLQEAGGVIWRQGFGQSHGRGAWPFQADYEFRRSVDYCSGAFLMVRADVLKACQGGFDPAFYPAYYEDLDLCVRIQKAGWRILYEPGAMILHAEYGSSASTGEALTLMERHHQIFTARHVDWLARYPEPGPVTRRIRSAERKSPRILVLDMEIPVISRGRGMPHTHAICRALVELGYEPTFFSLDTARESWATVHREITPGVEVVHEYGGHRLDVFLRRYHAEFDLMILVRPGTLEAVEIFRQRFPEWFEGLKLVYDAEALFAERTLMEGRLKNWPDIEQRYRTELEQELKMARRADAVWTVSRREQQILQSHGVPQVSVVRHAEDYEPGSTSFQDRKGFLFVGMLDLEKSPPNTDAVLWFLQEVWPLIRRDLGPSVEFTQVGQSEPNILSSIPKDGWVSLGTVPDLRPIYDRHRVFVVPTRFSAGIPLKICSAAAHGLPTVASDHLVEQLDWTADEDVLTVPTGDAEAFAAACVRLYRDEALWTRLRAHALKRIETEFSPACFREAIRQSLAACRA